MQGERSRRTIGMCGRVGAGDNSRADAMSEALGGVRSLVDRPVGVLRADASATRWSVPGWSEGRSEGWSEEEGRSAVSWSPTPLPDDLPADTLEVARHHDAFSLVVNGHAAQLHSGISGAAPIYVDGTGEDDGTIHFCSRIDPLLRTRPGGIRPDWHGWAHVLAAGGPLDGRTTVEGVRRLQPWSRIDVAAGSGASVTTAGWPWLDVDSGPEATLEPVREALAAAVAVLSSRGELACLLSGGWDSRVLAALAARETSRPLPTWTTSSDTGTVMEELVSAKVAERIGARHEIVPPRWDQFGADLDHFAQAVDYQTSFHVWLVPLARALVGTTRTVLDGLGGGLFVGGAFPDDDSTRPVLDKRFDRLVRYLPGAEEILHPRVVAQIEERTRESFENVAKPLVDHPFGSTFTAYLTRTLPGISLAPYGLMAGSAPMATPFLDDAVVRAALAIPPDQHADGQLYPQLLRSFDAELAELPTALELTPRERRHPRRISSPEAARTIRDLVSREPVCELLAPGLASADLETWSRHLDQTRPQHLLRGLATLSLWLERYADVLAETGVDELLGRG